MLRTLTIRVPEELYIAVHEASHDARLSMNKYCEAVLAKAVTDGVSELNSPEAASPAANAVSGEVRS